MLDTARWQDSRPSSDQENQVDLQTIGTVVAIAAGAVAVLGGVVKATAWLWRLPARRKERRATVAEVNEDLMARMEEISRLEKDQYDAIDRHTLKRNVYRSGIRLADHIRVAEAADAERESAIREWRRELRRLVGTSSSDPPVGKVVGDSVEVDGERFTRSALTEPIMCGWCHRLVYSNGGAWWCPDHGFNVS